MEIYCYGEIIKEMRINEKKILIVFGTRPEAIKMAPVINEFKKFPEKIILKVCVTAQHREMLDQILVFFNIKPDYDLDIMRANQSLYSLTSSIILGMQPILEDFMPDYVFVHGDTTTTLATSIASYYANSKVCHVEAGLRTHDKRSPFPEEINRAVTGRIADIHFAPTQRAKNNLLAENIKSEDILITGNTVIDALLLTLQKQEENSFNLKNILLPGKQLILVTGHRRENFGQGFKNLCYALKEISKIDNIQIVYPVHLNPNVQKPVFEILGKLDNIKLIPPMQYEEFVFLMKKSKLIITDSGGIQEEAPTLGIPVIVTRETSERPEAIEAGSAILVGTDKQKIVEITRKLLNDKMFYESMSKQHNPYGDGSASSKIVNYIINLRKDE